MSLDDWSTVTILSAGGNPTVPSQNVPLVLVQKLPAGWAVGRTRVYTDESVMLTDGFSTSDPGYIAVQRAFQQAQRPPYVIVGARRTNKTTQVVKLKCLSATTGDVYNITIITPAGVSTLIAYTVPGASTTTTVATAIAALIAAVSGFAGTTSATDTITIASPAVGSQNRFKNWTKNFNFSDQSADPGIATDLAAVKAERDDWYGLSIDTISKAEILAAAAWAESNKKLFIPQSSDTDIGDVAVTTDVASTVVTNAYRYTGVIYNGNDSQGFSGLAWQAQRFAGTPTPGDETWVAKSLAGVSTDANVDQTFIVAATAAAKRATVYVVVSGVNVTQSGTSGQVGVGEWIDVVRGVDWTRVNIQARLFARQVGASRVPYTDAGADSQAGTVEGVLNEAAGNGILDASFGFNVQAPKVSTIDATTRQSRVYGNITFAARLQGAIHKVNVLGSVSA